MSALELRQVTVSFGGVRALDSADLCVDAGALVGLIGPNGAGKTTLVDAVTGFVRSTGQITCGGREITRLRPDQRVRTGVSRTWQAAELFDDLDVLDNVLVGSERGGWRAPLRDLVRRRDTSARRQAEDSLERLGLLDRANEPIEHLTHAERKLVGVARALATAPQVLCLDEPAAGLDRQEAIAFGASVRKVAEDGVAVLLIDHDMGLVLGHCDSVYVLEFGTVIASGTPAAIQADERVVSAYLGKTHASRAGKVGAE